MAGIFDKKLIWVITLGLCLAIHGCGPGSVIEKDLAPKLDTSMTIGSLCEVFWSEWVPVRGIGLVGGLSGTGSGQCPPELREYLRKYILSQLPEYKNVDRLIDSPNTAVVGLYGKMPTSGRKNSYFDVKAVVIEGTGVSSLEGGIVYGAELLEAGKFGIATRPLARVEGPVFIDKTGDSKIEKKSGYILGGARALEEYMISIVLRKADYATAALIRDRLNTLFGRGVANALSSSHIEVNLPEKYSGQSRRFTSLIKATFVTEGRDVTEKRIKAFIRQLAASEDKQTAEIALEAIGNQSLGKLRALLNSMNEEVRLRAARCMLNLGSDDGLDILRQIASEGSSLYRVEALEAIGNAAERNDAAAICRKLLRDSDLDIRLAAYEQLRKLNSIAITRNRIGGKLYLEQIAKPGSQAIFVARSGKPRIVLFGAPIYCTDNLFIRSSDGNITINAPASGKYVSIIRKIASKTGTKSIRLKSSFELSDIIETLCGEPAEKGQNGHGGMNVSYSDAIAILEQLCLKGGIRAQFRAGPLPKID